MLMWRLWTLAASWFWCCHSTPEGAWINELHYDNSGTDVGEFVEIYLGPTTSMSGWRLELINGRGNAVYQDVSLATGTVTTLDSGAKLIVLEPSSIQNGAPDGMVLRDSSGAVAECLSYEGTLDVVTGCIEIPLTESSSTPVGDSLQRTDCGVGGTTWVAGAETKGSPNTGQSCLGAEVVVSTTRAPFVCNGNDTEISAIQGSGTSSPLVNQVASVRGVVTAVFSGLSGFFLQTVPGEEDGDAMTSEGLWISLTDPALQVTVGDIVRVSGEVKESYSLTTLEADQLVVCSSGHALPAHEMIPAGNSSLEQYEGMLMKVTPGWVVTDVYNLGRYSAFGVLRSPMRPFTGTQVSNPGPDAAYINDLIEARTMEIDDASTQQNPDPLIFPAPELAWNNTLRTGYTVTSAVGPLSYSFGAYKIIMETPDALTVSSSGNPRPEKPASLSGLLISSFNVLNYFKTFKDRGADDAGEFQRQRTKIISALVAIHADIVGLVEIENDGFGNKSSIADLLQGLNGATSAGNYEAIEFNSGSGGAIGTDAISCKIIYRPAVVTPVGTPAILDSSVDPAFIDTKNRPSVAASFTEVASGVTFTVVVNHLKSKGSDCDDLGDPDLHDGAGNCNGVRTNASKALGRWLATSPTGESTDKIIITGDMNAYKMEPPIQELLNQFGYTDLIAQHVGDSAYTYVFSGVAGTLDHMLATPAAASCVTGVDIWHINCDEPKVLDYDADYKSDRHVKFFYDEGPYRSSDHDPVTIGLNFAGCQADASTTAAAGAGTKNAVDHATQHANLGMATFLSVVACALVFGRAAGA